MGLDLVRQGNALLRGTERPWHWRRSSSGGDRTLQATWSGSGPCAPNAVTSARRCSIRAGPAIRSALSRSLWTWWRD